MRDEARRPGEGGFSNRGSVVALLILNSLAVAGFLYHRSIDGLWRWLADEPLVIPPEGIVLEELAARVALNELLVAGNVMVLAGMIWLGVATLAHVSERTGRGRRLGPVYPTPSWLRWAVFPTLALYALSLACVFAVAVANAA